MPPHDFQMGAERAYWPPPLPCRCGNNQPTDPSGGIPDRLVLIVILNCTDVVETAAQAWCGKVDVNACRRSLDYIPDLPTNVKRTVRCGVRYWAIQRPTSTRRGQQQQCHNRSSSQPGYVFAFKRGHGGKTVWSASR